MAEVAATPVRQVLVVVVAWWACPRRSLAHEGASATVLERTPHGSYEGGGGLGVDVDLLARVTGLAGSPPVCQGLDRATTVWPLLAGWLETQAGAVSGVEVKRGAEAVDVGDGWARTADGRRFDADLVIGADGARSTVRRWVSPKTLSAAYAGFLLWRAMVAEAELRPPSRGSGPTNPPGNPT